MGSPRRRRISHAEIEQSSLGVHDQFEHEGVLYRFDGRPLLKLIKSLPRKLESRVSALVLGIPFSFRPSALAIALLAYWNYDDPWGFSVWVGSETHVSLLRHLVP